MRTPDHIDESESISFDPAALELSKLDEDLSDTTNLATRRPELARELHTQLAAWRQDVGAEMMQPIVFGQHLWQDSHDLRYL